MCVSASRERVRACNTLVPIYLDLYARSLISLPNRLLKATDANLDERDSLCSNITTAKHCACHMDKFRRYGLLPACLREESFLEQH